MSSFTYDEGAMQMGSGGTVNWSSDTIEIMIVKSTYVAAKADTNSVYAAAEITGVAGYVGGFGGAGRKVLGSKTKTKDTTAHQIIYNAANPTAWTLGTGDTVGGLIVGKKGSADDTTATPIFFLDITDFPTNGSTFTLTFNAGGIGVTQQ